MSGFLTFNTGVGLQAMPRRNAGAPSAPAAVLLIVAGQSNSRKANTQALTGPARYANLASAADVKIWNPVAGAWVDYTTTNAATRTCGSRAGTDATPDRAWGTEAEVIYRMRLAGDNRPVFVLKQSVNGTSMALDWLPPSGGQWTNFKGQTDAALPALRAAWTLSEYLLWNQGEADANDDASTNGFAANFNTFMTNLRASVTPGAMFIAEQLRPLGYETGAIANSVPAIARAYAVREAQAARLVADGNFKIISTSWAQENWDDLHPSDTYADPVSGTIDLWISGRQTQSSAADHGIGQRAYAAIIGTHDATYGSLTDTAPDAFTFADNDGASANTLVSSNVITPVGFGRRTAISIAGNSGAEYQITNWDDSVAVAWTSTSGTLDPMQKVQVRVTSGGATNDVRGATLTIGGVSDTFSVTTAAAVSYLAETQAFIDALIVENGSDPWNATKKAALNTFIDTAKTGANPFWSSILSLYLGGLDPVAAARIDVKRAGSGGAGYSEFVRSGSSNEPQWTDNAGWSNNANSGSGGTLAINPSTATTQNDIGLGGYFKTRQTSSVSTLDLLDEQSTAANVRLQLTVFDAGTSTSINARLNSGAAATVTGLPDTNGFYHAVRTAGTGTGSVRIYGPAGSEIANQNVTSVVPTSTGLFFGRATTGLTNNGVLGGFWLTTTMTAAQVQAFRDALVTLLTAFGAN